MTKATAPITGGMSWPPFDAQASTAAASFPACRSAPQRKLVTTPTATVVAAAMPEIMPNRLSPSTASSPARRGSALSADGDVVEEIRAARRIKQLPISTNG